MHQKCRKVKGVSGIRYPCSTNQKSIKNYLFFAISYIINSIIHHSAVSFLQNKKWPMLHLPTIKLKKKKNKKKKKKNKHKKTNIKNYRPVSILPTLSTIYERCSYSQIYSYFDPILLN